MSLYGDYLKEVRGDEILEDEGCFATYRYINNDKTVYIVDIYVRPEFRKKHCASNLADAIAAIAKQKGATEMLGTVIPSALTSTNSLKTLLAYGMTVVSASNDLIILRKDL